MDQELSRIRKFHEIIPLAGSQKNALLNLPDEQQFYLISLIQNKPTSPPDLSIEEWDGFFSLLRPQRIMPLIAYNIRSWPDEFKPPAEKVSELNQIFLMGAVKNLLIGRQIQEVVDALDKAGIESLLLKGPALGRSVYPDPAMRLSGDIDLLVKPGDLKRSEKILSDDLGYTCKMDCHQFSAEEFHHQIYIPKNKGVTIELHWSADGGYGIFSEDWLDTIFKRKIQIDSEDLKCNTLCPVDNLFFLAYHDIFQHQTLQLDWIVDIARVINSLKYPEDWEELRNKCKKYHIRRSLELALEAASLWVDEKIPEDYSDFSTWPEICQYEIELWQYAPTMNSSLKSILYFKLLRSPSILDKTFSLFRFVFPPIPLLYGYRRSESRIDIPLAYFRRWYKALRLSG